MNGPINFCQGFGFFPLVFPDVINLNSGGSTVSSIPQPSHRPLVKFRVQLPIVIPFLFVQLFAVLARRVTVVFVT